MASEFLFDSFASKSPQSTRKQHLKTVYDILCLSILRRDMRRAKRSWAILLRCPDFDTSSLWRIGLSFITSESEGDISVDSQPRLDFLRATMLREKDNVGSISQFFHCRFVTGVERADTCGNSARSDQGKALSRCIG